VEKPRGAAGLQAITGIPAGADGVGLLIGLFFRLLGFGLFLEDIGFSAADTLKYIGELFGRADNQGLSVFQLVNLIDQIVNNVKSLFNTFSKILSDFLNMLFPKKKDPIIVNGWLKLYANPTVAGTPDRIIDLEKDEQGELRPKPASWAFFENKTYISKYVRDYLELDGITPVVKPGAKNALINENGRYWIAVGPKVLAPNYPDSGKCEAGDPNFYKKGVYNKWNCRIDIVVKDDAGNEYYIPCVPGDIKHVTYNNGIFQSGWSYPNGGGPYPDNKEPCAIEFIAPRKLQTASFEKALTAVKFIIYE